MRRVDQQKAVQHAELLGDEIAKERIAGMASGAVVDGQAARLLVLESKVVLVN